MTQHIDTIFTDGAFRPQHPVDFVEGDRVKLTVASEKHTAASDAEEDADDDLSDIDDLLAHEYVEICRSRMGSVPTLEEVRRRLSVYTGSLADDLAAERDER